MTLRVGPTCALALLLLSASFVRVDAELPQSAPVNPLTYPGADLGVRANAAFAAMPGSNGTVRIPAGEYSFATTIRLNHEGQHLVCDPGAVLRYTGVEDAILIDPHAVHSQELGMDGEGGCLLEGNPRAKNGIEIAPSNATVIRSMRIYDFPQGNGIRLSGANSVQLLNNSISRCRHGIDMVTVPHYAPNAVHVANSEISGNEWAVYSHDGHVPATRALGNVYRDNVFEANTVGDLMLGWDAHTIVEGNYFESPGVAIAAGTDGANVYDIHIIRNYFTAANYRSEIELGYGWNFFVEGNYEEGVNGALSGCAVNAIPGDHGGIQGVVLTNAFSRFSEGAMSAHELCYKGSPAIPPGVLGTTRMSGDLALDGSLKLQHGTVSSTDAAIRAGDGCKPEGVLSVSTPNGQPARLYFCSGGHWEQVGGRH